MLICNAFIIRMLLIVLSSSIFIDFVNQNQVTFAKYCKNYKSEFFFEGKKASLQL